VVTCPVTDPSTGDISQQTDGGGTLYQRANTGFTIFTDGSTHWQYAVDPDGTDDAVVWTTGEIDAPDGATTVSQQKADAATAKAQAAAEAAAAQAADAANANVAGAAEHCRVVTPGLGFVSLFTGAGATTECDFIARLDGGNTSWDTAPVSSHWLCQADTNGVKDTVVVSQPRAPGDAWHQCVQLTAGGGRWSPDGTTAGIAAPLN
jgi:hypothetical protein